MTDQKEIAPSEGTSGTIPAQPTTDNNLKKSLPIIGGIAAVVLIIGLANAAHITGGGAKEAPRSALAMKPTATPAGQVNSFETQQRLQMQHDQAERERQTQLLAQMNQLQQEQAVPGPEDPNAAPMTPAQRQAIYGANSPNAPQKTSGVSEAQAQAKQRQLAREKEHQDAVNSDTVAIDFARSATPEGKANVLADSAAGQETASTEDGEPITAPSEASSGSRADQQGGSASVRNVSTTQPRKNPMSGYDFDGYQGRLYRVFEGTVFEGVVTNHIDGGFAGPMIVMLTTDYYSHDHQQLLLPQGTRLIGNVQSVSSGGQRKLFVVFNRAVCPDGFSLDLTKFLGLDPLGTTGLATNVNNHYLSSFAAAAAVGGIGGLAQVGNSGSVLDSSTQIRNGISAQTAQESEQVLNKFLNRLPVITVKEGSRARVYINQDILIPSYAEHRVDPAL